METGTKSSLRAADRLGQTLAALARLLDQMMNDVQAVNSEFQERVQQTAQETESAIQELADERLKIAIQETERTTRAQVSEELQARFKREMSAAVEEVRKKLTAERDRLSEELDMLRQAAVEWDNERTRLLADSTRANELLEQSKDEHHRALAESDEAAAIALELQIATAADRVRTDLSARFDKEREQLIAERDRVNRTLAEQNTEYQQMIAATEEVAEGHKKSMAAAQQQWDAERAKLVAEHQKAQQKAASAPSPEKSRALEALATEVARVETLIKAISEVIEEPSTELSVVIRKNAERAELESYLRGVRFSIQGR